MRTASQNGFTLIELSIVLVIIGLIVGGVLVGQDLIEAAAIRAQISQIEKFQTATHTFETKYNALPGDITANVAAAIGLLPRGSLPGQGDGDGLIAGNSLNQPAAASGYDESAGETQLFWADLSMAGLIQGSFTSASASLFAPLVSGIDNYAKYFPLAKIGRGNLVYVGSGGSGNWASVNNRANYFAIGSVSGCGFCVLDYVSQVEPFTHPGLTTIEASNIDAKVDDGLPQTGSVTATYINFYLQWAAQADLQGASTGTPNYAPTTAATAGSATTCYDNSAGGAGNPGVNGATQHYSVEIDGGNDVNCALSFRFQ